MGRDDELLRLTDRERAVRVLSEVLLWELFEQAEVDACRADPKRLLGRMSAVDERQAEAFRFLQEPGWEWQGEFFDWLHGEQRCIALKARQLGVTWLACAYVCWTMLYKPGSLCLVYRQKEEEAHENVGRCWDLLNSLPAHLLCGAVVEKPDRGARASGEIRLRFLDGRRSRVLAMTSASASGHGKTAAVVLLDEHSRIDRAGEISKAVEPAAGTHGKILIISTANGVADEEGNGNHFAWMWDNAEEAGYARRFLSWRLHPDRDDDWYQNSPEVRALKSHERAEQYPDNPDEAFTLTNRVFFDPDDIKHYGSLHPNLLYRAAFVESLVGEARLAKSDRGMLRVYVEPQGGHGYAVGADVATGRGRDYTAAYVVDLGSMELVAEFHGRLDADLFATQLHYLGRWYNNALIAVETAGGFGEAVIIPLRDGRAGRPAYPKLYRHVLSSRPDLPVSKVFGFPTNVKTRPLILNQLEQAVRERALPWLTPLLLAEMRTFVYRDTGPSPAAQEGARDDCVMAAAIALEMFRLRGHHPNRQQKRSQKRYRHWLSKAA